MKKNNLHDLLDNTKDVNIERLTEGRKVMTDAEKERIFAMSKQKLYDMKNGISTDMGADRVNGVESYSRPIIMKFAGMAAAAVLLIGGIGGGAYIAHNMKNTAPDNVNITQTATGTITTSYVSTDENTDTHTTAAENTVTTAVSTDSSQDKPKKEEDKVNQNTSEIEEDAQKATEEEIQRKIAEEAARAEKEAEDNAKTAAEQQLIDTARRITDDYVNIYRIRWGWLTTDSSDFFTLGNDAIITEYGGYRYFRVSDPAFDSVDKIRSFMSTHCTKNLFDADKIPDIDKKAQKSAEKHEQKDFYYYASESEFYDNYNTYYTKDVNLYLTPGQLGYNFGGWADKPVEIINNSETSFTAKRGYINDFDNSLIEYVNFTFIKDSATGNWLINDIQSADVF